MGIEWEIVVQHTGIAMKMTASSLAEELGIRVGTFVKGRALGALWRRMSFEEMFGRPAQVRELEVAAERVGDANKGVGCSRTR